MRPEYEKIAELFGLTVEGDLEPEDAPRERLREGRTSAESAEIAAERLAEGKVAESVRFYQQAIEQKGEEDAGLFTDLGAAFEYGDEAPQAVRQYLKALKSSPKESEPLLGLSAIFRREGRFHESVARLEEALKEQPEDAYLWCKLAETLREMGERKKALTAIEMAVRNKPDQSHFHYWMGDLLIQMGRYEESLEAIRAAIQLSPGDAHLLLLASVGFWRTGRQQDAVRSMELASDLDTEDRLYPAIATFLKSKLDPGSEAPSRDLDRYDEDRMARLLRQMGINLQS